MFRDGGVRMGDLRRGRRFPYGSLAVLLVVSFALGALVMHEVWQWNLPPDGPFEIIGGAAPQRDWVLIGMRGFSALLMILAIVVEAGALAAQARPHAAGAEPREAEAGLPRATAWEAERAAHRPGPDVRAAGPGAAAAPGSAVV